MGKEVRILVVEDEFMISEDIALRLSDFGYTVEGIASSAEQALEILENHEIELALLDVNIDGEMDGIQLSKIISEKYNIPFIFLTSLASRAIVERAKETNPSAYLLKPFNDRQVQIAIDMALANFSDNIVASVSDIEQPKDNAFNTVIQMKDSLFLKKDTHFERVRFSDIIYLSAESNYTIINTKNGKYIYSCVLKRFEEKLPDNIFARIHRSYLVNVNFISGFEGNSLHLGDHRVPVSRYYRDELYKNFNII